MKNILQILAAFLILSSLSLDCEEEKLASEVSLSSFNGTWKARCFYISGDEYAMSELDSYILLEIEDGIVFYSQGDAGEDDEVCGFDTIQETLTTSFRDGLLTTEAFEHSEAMHFRLQDDGTLTRNYFNNNDEYVGFLFDRVS